MAITLATGFPVNGSTPFTSVAITTATVGDHVTVFVNYTAGSVTSISDTNSRISWNTTSTRSDAFSGSSIDTWEGIVLSTGTTTVNINGSGLTSVDLVVYEHTSNLVPTCDWVLIAGGTNTGTSATITWPSLTSQAMAQQMYVGFTGASHTPSAGATSGFTYDVTNDGDIACQNPAVAVSSAIQPTASQSLSGVFNAVGIIVACQPRIGGAPPQWARQWTPPARSNHYFQQPRWVINQASAVNNAATPLDTAWQAGGNLWHVYNAAVAQDRTVRTWQRHQRPYISNPSLLSTALLEDALLGNVDDPARHRSWRRDWDRHPFIQPQRPYTSDQSSARNDFDETQAGFLGQSYWYWRRDWYFYPWVQKDMRDANRVASARNDFDETQAGYLPQPYWTWYRPWDRYPFIQKDMRDANRVGSAVNDLDTTTDGDDLSRHRSWRRDWDQYRGLQRPYISTVGLLDTALLEDVLLGRADNERHAWWRRDAYWSAPGKRGSDPSLLTPPNVTPTLLFLDLVDGSLHLQFGSTEMTYRLT